MNKNEGIAMLTYLLISNEGIAMLIYFKNATKLHFRTQKMFDTREKTVFPSQARRAFIIQGEACLKDKLAAKGCFSS